MLGASGHTGLRRLSPVASRALLLALGAFVTVLVVVGLLSIFRGVGKQEKAPQQEQVNVAEVALNSTCSNFPSEMLTAGMSPPRLAATGAGGDEDGTAYIKFLAFYFPQFHRFPENDMLWGAGFTDFTNLERVEYNQGNFQILKPAADVGYYNLLDVDVRRRQARQARRFGVHGFVFHVYWFDGKPVMHMPLLKMLEDGEPDLPFCFHWANEPWTNSWDGGNRETLLPQKYGETEEEWARHFEWLLPFFRHRNYIRVENKPVFMVYRLSEVTRAQEMLAHWNKLALPHGMDGIFLLQVLNIPFTPDTNMVKDWVDGVVEYYPNYGTPHYDPRSHALKPRLHRVHYRGAYVAWDNTPRHLTDGKATVTWVRTPEIFGHDLVQVMKRVQRDPNEHRLENFVFVNAWNEWGEGCAMEPSQMFGTGYLEQFARAREQTGSLSGGTLIVVRTYVGHDPYSPRRFNLRRMLESLLAQKNRHWVAVVVESDAQSFDNLPRLLAELGDGRIRHLPVPDHLRKPYNPDDAAYPVTDWAIATAACWYPGMKWLLVTNGDNYYHPDALSHLDTAYDLIGLNFMSRWLSWNNAPQQRSGWDQRCTLLQPERQRGACQTNLFRVGFVDLGALIFRLDRFVSEGRQFSTYTAQCHSCQDGVLAEQLIKDGWKARAVEGAECMFRHEPTIQSCREEGGLWFDSPLFEEYGCHDIDHLNQWGLRTGEYRALDMALFARDPWCIRYHQATYESMQRQSALRPECFDYRFYVHRSPDLQQFFGDRSGAFQHYLVNGQYERRDFRSTCTSYTPVNFLFVVRTHAGHAGDLALPSLLRSLREMEEKAWVAVLYRAGGLPFRELETIAQSFMDSRIMIFPQASGSEFPFPASSSFTPDDDESSLAELDIVLNGVWRQLFDKRMSLPRWLVITNGNTYYAPKALNEVRFESPVHAYLLPMESHLQPLDDKAPDDRCGFVESRARACQPCDEESGVFSLGAMVLDYAKLRAAGMSRLRIGSLKPSLGCQGPECPRPEELILQALKAAGWATRALAVPDWAAETKVCPFSLNPAPGNCVNRGMVWIDSPLESERRCVPLAEATGLAKQPYYDSQHFYSAANKQQCLRYTATHAAAVISGAAEGRVVELGFDHGHGRRRSRADLARRTSSSVMSVLVDSGALHALSYVALSVLIVAIAYWAKKRFSGSKMHRED